MEKKFEIWIEGYLCTGLEGRPAPASFHGVYEAENFLEACRRWAAEHDKNGNYREDGGQPTFWACSMFDNEKDARKSFG